MKLRYKMLLLLALVLMWPVMAEERPTEVMVVTAKRLPTDTGRFSGSVSVITAEQIKSRSYRVLDDVLRDLPGLYTAVSGGIGAQTSVFIRGTESDHVLILIDGVEVSDPAAGNRYEFSQLSLNGVERIEVLRGNYSAEYGSEALGGIINIITRTPTENNMTAHIDAGSFDRYTAAVDLDATYKDFDFSLSGGYFETAGESFTPSHIRQSNNCTIKYEERDGYRNSNAKMNVGWLLIPKTNTKLTLKSAYSQTDLEYDEPVCEGYLEQSSYTKRTTIALVGDYWNGMWSPIWRLNYYTRDSRNTNSPKNRGERFKLNWHNVLRPYRDLSVAFGIETELEQAQKNNGFDADARSNAFYGELHYTPAPIWHFNAGWRADDADDFASEHSYRMGVVLHANLHTRLHANYATAFKAPSLLDRFEDFPAFNFFANPHLKPETSHSWEVGIEQNWLQWRYGFTYFNNEIDDLIDFTFNPVNFSSTLINQSRTHIRGLENFVVFQPHKTLAMRLDYVQTRAYNQDNQRLLRRPIRQALLSLDYTPDKGVLADWTVGVIFNYTGPQNDVDRVTFNRVAKGGYTLTDLNISYSINDHLQLYGGVNNLFNKSYEPVAGYKGADLAAHIGVSLR